MLILTELTGSIRGRAAAEVRNHLRSSQALKDRRYPIWLRALHAAFETMSFSRWLCFYVLSALLLVLAEGANQEYCGGGGCPFVMPSILTYSADKLSRLKDVATVLAGTQVGVLGVLSLAVSLVTLIGQREHAGADVRAYFHESLALPLAESSLALLLVLCLQMAWPGQFLVHRFHVATTYMAGEITLTSVHMAWLAINLIGLAHFIVVSLQFSHPDDRAEFRQRFVANAVVPSNLLSQILAANYSMTAERIGFPWLHGAGPMISFGSGSSLPDTMIGPITTRGKTLVDLWERPLKWALQSWAKRLPQTSGPAVGVQLSFSPRIAASLREGEPLCRGQAAVPFTSWERWLLQVSFKFGHADRD